MCIRDSPETKPTAKKPEPAKSNDQEQSANGNQKPVFKAKQNMDAPQKDIDPADNNIDNAIPKSANPGFPKKP